LALRISARLRAWLILLFAAFIAVPNAKAGDYRLQPGDVLEIAITGIPGFVQRVPIDLEGNVGLPLAGQLKVGALTLPLARTEIAQEFSNKQYRQFAPDGHEISHLILSDEVIVTVAEYNPVYVNGDVARPGAYPFRPGMTVRQAIAVAGGFDPVKFRVADPLIQAADLQTEYQRLWVNFAWEQARSWRLKNELGDKVPDNPIANVPIPADVAKRFMEAQSEQLKARTADRDNSKALLQVAIRKAGVQLGVLAEKKQKDEEGSQADLADLNTVRELFRKGLTQNMRLSESRRAALLSSDQLLQTIVEMSNVERQRDEYARQLDKVDTQARIEALQELQQSNLHLGEIAAQLKGAADKLMHVGLLRSQMAGGGGAKPEITVFRRSGNGSQRLVANEDLDLTPSDVVEVKLPTPGLDIMRTSSANALPGLPPAGTSAR
jgi:polysaccharide export outer membrane protein